MANTTFYGKIVHSEITARADKAFIRTSGNRVAYIDKLARLRAMERKMKNKFGLIGGSVFKPVIGMNICIYSGINSFIDFCNLTDRGTAWSDPSIWKKWKIISVKESTGEIFLERGAFFHKRYLAIQLKKDQADLFFTGNVMRFSISQVYAFESEERGEYKDLSTSHEKPLGVLRLELE